MQHRNVYGRRHSKQGWSFSEDFKIKVGLFIAVVAFLVVSKLDYNSQMQIDPHTTAAETVTYGIGK